MANARPRGARAHRHRRRPLPRVRPPLVSQDGRKPRRLELDLTDGHHFLRTRPRRDAGWAGRRRHVCAAQRAERHPLPRLRRWRARGDAARRRRAHRQVPDEVRLRGNRLVVCHRADGLCADCVFRRPRLHALRPADGPRGGLQRLRLLPPREGRRVGGNAAPPPRPARRSGGRHEGRLLHHPLAG